MYKGILTYVQGSEEKPGCMFILELTGLKNPLTSGDVASMAEELYGGRSILSSIPAKLVFIRWKKPLTSSVSRIGQGKGEQKCSTIRLQDLKLCQIMSKLSLVVYKLQKVSSHTCSSTGADTRCAGFNPSRYRP
ncbi:hypothetical protein ACQKWADRAFT_250660 [Trichoderma austrokoningii]